MLSNCKKGNRKNHITINNNLEIKILSPFLAHRITFKWQLANFTYTAPARSPDNKFEKIQIITQIESKPINIYLVSPRCRHNWVLFFHQLSEGNKNGMQGLPETISARCMWSRGHDFTNGDQIQLLNNLIHMLNWIQPYLSIQDQNDEQIFPLFTILFMRGKNARNRRSHQTEIEKKKEKEDQSAQRENERGIINLNYMIWKAWKRWRLCRISRQRLRIWSRISPSRRASSRLGSRSPRPSLNDRPLTTLLLLLQTIFSYRRFFFLAGMKPERGKNNKKKLIEFGGKRYQKTPFIVCWIHISVNQILSISHQNKNNLC